MNGAASNQPWAIVLAGGDGRRLCNLAIDRAGNTIPKQFCSLNGGASLISQTIARAEPVVGADRITAVVSASHAPYWRTGLRMLPRRNVVVQPMNRGTGIGILLPTLRILERDPDATILILPSDHHVADEQVLRAAMRTALDEVRDHPTGIALLGIHPDEPDSELGYLLPAGTQGKLWGLRGFVEKPSEQHARLLIRQGALWNSFIVVCRGQSLVDLFSTRHASLVQTLRGTDLSDDDAVRRAYAQLSALDFSRDVAIGEDRRLAVMPVPDCGWSDLGTPRRLAQTLARCRLPVHHVPSRSRAIEPLVNLAERLKQAEFELVEKRCSITA